MTFKDESPHQAALKIVFSGGIAGIVTWGSVFPLDMIKTRLQAQPMYGHAITPVPGESQALLQSQRPILSSFQIARETYRAEGLKAFYRGLGVCSVRAFIVNAVQVSYSVHQTGSKLNLCSGQPTNG